MAGGGHIIIRSAVKQAASVETVRENLSPNSQAKLDLLLAKDVASWSCGDTCEALYLIGEADYHASR